MEVLIKEDGSKGFAMARENSKRAGIMTYSITSPELIIIDHTEVEPAFEGKGVGKVLLYKIVEMAREKNIKIIPLCPYAASMFKKLDDIKDVLKA
ncbi:GNAT family N-acetyltransferase [Flavihumibacter sp. UBA7668]|uniref:GNAT family N-acetyltransferase n=1 Tax=Flavihumibacter sp. UBA7668 TaxID=1946542 RepID=UPI0025C6481A|nr:GNAT family N-acetyltransferase [Flavihumibacter sp. UBA7668]